eukprot:2363886-Ditylum_brightwellii.AAC.1
MSPLEVLRGHKEEIAVEDYHSWGCPIFVLDSRLQSGQGIGPPKWDPRAQAGVYQCSLGTQPVDWPCDPTVPHECATTESYTIAFTWYEGEEAHRATGEQVNEDPVKMREKAQDEMREPQ